MHEILKNNNNALKKIFFRKNIERIIQISKGIQIVNKSIRDGVRISVTRIGKNYGRNHPDK